MFQELQDLGRDPPAQCSAGPVGDDCEYFLITFSENNKIPLQIYTYAQVCLKDF